MPTLNIFELTPRFRKSVECLWRYRIFARTVYTLKVANFQMLSMCKVFALPLQKQNSWAPETFHPNVDPQHLRAEAKISKIGWIPLKILGFCWHSVQVESGKISNLVHARSFNLPILKVKHLRTGNFPPKCPPSTSSSWGKDFENRLNAFGETGFLLAQCTGWSWQNFKCRRCAKFSPCHCKSKIPGHLKLSTQMSTLIHLRAEANISKIGWMPFKRLQDFCPHSVQVESGKISNVVDVQSFHLAIAKVKYLGTWTFHTNVHPQHLRAEANISKIGWIPVGDASIFART